MKNGLFEASDADYKISYGTRGQLLWPKDSPISEVSETLETISIDKANALIPALLNQLAGDGEFTGEDFFAQTVCNVAASDECASIANTKLRALRAADKAEIEKLEALAKQRHDERNAWENNSKFYYVKMGELDVENAALREQLAHKTAGAHYEEQHHRIMDLTERLRLSKVETAEWQQQAATSGEVIHRLSGRTDNSLTAQAWICPNCHDDHSKISVCPEFARLTREREGAPVVYGSGEPSTLVWSKFKPSGISVNIHQARLVDIKEIK